MIITTKKKNRNNWKQNPVIGINLINGIIIEFNSSTKCLDSGFINCGVIKCCNNEEKSYKNYLWFYKKDFTEVLLQEKLKIYRKRWYRPKKNIVEKSCSVCKQIKKIDKFYKSSISAVGVTSSCKECSNKQAKLYHRKKYKENHAKIRAYFKEYKTNRMKNDPLFKLRATVSARLRTALKKHKNQHATLEWLGCSIQELKVYIEKQFKLGMSWNNYNLHGWHIDHIIPLFTAKIKEDFEKVCHYTNLRPLWAKENLGRSKKIG